jgi:hypothetical protein
MVSKQIGSTLPWNGGNRRWKYHQDNSRENNSRFHKAVTMNESPNIVETNEAEDVAGSVRQALVCWELVMDDPHTWKWVILALHNALQGACVCHLVSTASPVGAVTKSNESQWIDYFENKRSDETQQPPKTVLMALPELLKAVRKPNSVGQKLDLGHHVAISDSELQWLIRIHKEFRNQFIHYSPTGWVFDVSGMPKLAQLIARIINDILDGYWAFRKLSEERRNELKENLALLASINKSVGIRQ